jgi:hypothetical protein
MTNPAVPSWEYWHTNPPTSFTSSGLGKNNPSSTAPDERNTRSIEEAPPSSLFLTFPIDDLNYAPSAAERERHAAQRVATGRKASKTTGDNTGEAVWPPHLEEALITALKEYKPDAMQQTTSTRKPWRNKFISHYILQTMGKFRTAKQVSSRLQQLQRTGSLEILELINGTTGNPPTTARLVHASPPIDNSNLVQHSNMWIDILVGNGPTPNTSPPSIHLYQRAHETLELHSLCRQYYPFLKKSGLPAYGTSPHISFISPIPLFTRTVITVYWRGLAVYKDILDMILWCNQDGAGWIYTSPLVSPPRWPFLRMRDMTEFVLMQELLPQKRGSQPLFINYVFRCSTCSAHPLTFRADPEISYIYNDGTAL